MIRPISAQVNMMMSNRRTPKQVNMMRSIRLQVSMMTSMNAGEHDDVEQVDPPSR